MAAKPKAKIADAWVQVLLSMDGVADALEKGLDAASKKATTKAGKAMGESLGKEAGEALGDNFDKGADNAADSIKKLKGELGKLQGDLDGLDLDLDGLDDSWEATSILDEISRVEKELNALEFPDFDFDTDAFSRELRDLEKEMDKLSDDMVLTPTVDDEGVSQAFDGMGSDLGGKATEIGDGAGKKLGGALAAGFVALGVGQILGDALGSALEQEGLDNKTAAALALSEEDAAKVAEASTALFAANYGESYEAVQEAMRGIVGSVEGAREASSEELEAMGKDMLNVSSTYGLGADEILKAVQSQLSTGFASSWDEAVSTVVGGLQTMGSNGDDWIESLAEYSDDFKTLGLDSSESMNLVNAALEAGMRNTDVLLDGIQEMQIKLADESSWEALNGMGIDPKQLQAEIAKGGDDAQAAILGVWQKIQDAGGDRKMFADIFGTTAEDNYLAFANTELEGVNAKLDEAVGNMEEFDSTLNSGTNASLDTFMRLIQMGFVELLQPVLETVTPLLGEFVTWLSQNEEVAAVLAGVLGGVLLIAIGAVTAALWAMIAPVLANPITWIVVAVVAGIAALIAIIWVLAANWDTIMAAIGQGLEAFGAWVGSIFGAIGDFFAGLWTNITDGFNNAVQWVKDALGNVGNWFKDLGKGIANFFIGVVNAAIDGINGLIGLINGISFDIPSWLGGGKFGFDIPTVGRIPELAEGATVKPTPGGTLAILAEAGRSEAVVDEGLLNRALENGLAGTSNTSSSPTINVYQQPGESTEELVERIAEYVGFNSLVGAG